MTRDPGLFLEDSDLAKPTLADRARQGDPDDSAPDNSDAVAQLADHPPSTMMS
jgi:hypothetical protein